MKCYYYRFTVLDLAPEHEKYPISGTIKLSQSSIISHSPTRTHTTEDLDKTMAIVCSWDGSDLYHGSFIILLFADCTLTSNQQHSLFNVISPRYDLHPPFYT